MNEHIVFTGDPQAPYDVVMFHINEPDKQKGEIDAILRRGNIHFKFSQEHPELDGFLAFFKVQDNDPELTCAKVLYECLEVQGIKAELLGGEVYVYGMKPLRESDNK